MPSLIERKDCPMRHENGNCTPAGGFCTAVNDPICTALHNAYECGIFNVPVPCRIGDVVYGIREYKGVPNVQKGFVSEMFFTKDMKLMIVIKYVCRGYWLDRVFPTYEAAEAAIREKGE